MKLSYIDLFGDGKRHKIKAEITTEHPASSYGIPVIVLPDGGIVDLQSWISLNYSVEQISKKEEPLLKRVLENFSAMIGTTIEAKKQLTAVQIYKMLGISRQAFWNLKSRKDFPDPVFKDGRIELWNEEDIKKYIENRKK